MKTIFISHASKDKELIDAFVDLIDTGVGIETNSIFCTSLESLGIPAGENLPNFIKGKIDEANLAITVITENFLERQFCLTELGASWMIKKVYTILVPPVSFGDVKTLLGEVQFAILNDKSSLNEMRDYLIKVLNISSPVPTARWEVKRDQFLNKFTEIIKKIPPPSKVSFDEFSKLSEAYQESLKVNAECDNKIKTLNSTIEEIRKLKDKAEITKAMAGMIEKESEKFEYLTKNIRKGWNVFTPYTLKVVIEAFYYDLRNDRYEAVAELRERFQDAVERRYLKIKDGYDGPNFINLDLSHPKIKEIHKLLEELQQFVGKASAEFVSWYEDKYGDVFDMTSRTFWERHLGL